MEISKDLLKAIKQAQEGKEEGFNKIYSSTYNLVYFRSKTIMKTDDEAWDLLQEVYIVAYKSISNLERPENLYAWLGGIAYNLGMKAYRKKKEVLLDEENEGFFEDIRSTDKDIQPEEYVEDKQTSNIVKELIDLLPELQKAAVIAYYFDEMSVGEIADKFECSTGTIKSRLNYARQYLKQAVEAKEKKDNIKLHSITIPTILIALRMLSEDTTVSAQTAQILYNGVCSSIGVKAMSLSIVANGVNVSNIVGAGTQAAGTATKATGLFAKFTVASIGTKTAIIGLTAIAGMSLIIGGVSIKNSIDNKPSGSVVAIEATPTPVIVKEAVITVTPTAQPEADNTIELTEEENTIFKLIIHGLTDSVDSGYIKGEPLTDEQKMGIAYQVMYSLCVPEGNILGYKETNKEYYDPNFEGDALVSKAYIIPKEDIDHLLNTIIGETISEDKDYEGFIYDSGQYFLIEACTYVGFKDFWIDDKSVSYNYKKSRKFENISLDTTEGKAIEEGTREIGYAGTDGIETIEKSKYNIEFEAVEPTKFGRYSLVRYQCEKVDDTSSSSGSAQDVSMSTNAYELMKNYLPEHVQEVSKGYYSDYEYSEYFIYDWNKNKVPILIIRDVLNNDVKTCFYRDYHYIESKNILEDYSQSIYGSWDSSFYKNGDSFIMVTDYITDEAESYGAYLYEDLKGADTKKEELWFWLRNNISQTTQFLDLDYYKEKRAEVESLEQIKWFSIDDLSPFK